MSPTRDEVKIENQCDVMVIGPETRVYHQHFIFVTMVPRRVMAHKPSERFKVADLGRIKRPLSRKEIYEDLA